MVDEFQAQGFRLTLRQFFYQMVARDTIPNRHSEYKALGELAKSARLAGLLDWDAIEDKGTADQHPLDVRQPIGKLCGPGPCHTDVTA